MWDLIVSVPDHCLSFYFISVLSECLCCLYGVFYAHIDD